MVLWSVQFVHVFSYLYMLYKCICTRRDEWCGRFWQRCLEGNKTKILKTFLSSVPWILMVIIWNWANAYVGKVPKMRMRNFRLDTLCTFLKTGLSSFHPRLDELTQSLCCPHSLWKQSKAVMMGYTSEMERWMGQRKISWRRGITCEWGVTDRGCRQIILIELTEFMVCHSLVRINDSVVIFLWFSCDLF